MGEDPAEQLARSWRANAAAWTRSVREQQIETRRLVTDAAIVAAVVAGRPRRVLDVGCGEGWLCRALTAYGIETVGVDASAPLIEAAREAGGATYHVCTYAALAAVPAQFGFFDAVVCNFALLEAEPVPLLKALRSLMADGGVLLIQTVHPWAARGEGPYRDGWRTESFDGFGPGFTEPMPWFYRTLASWAASLQEAGWRIRELHEPQHPQTGLPVSVLFACTLATGEQASSSGAG